MLVRSGTALTVPILFPLGAPDAGVSYVVYDETGATLGEDTAQVPEGAVSLNLQVQADANTLPPGTLLGYRDLAWTYTVAGIVQNGEQRYSVEARLPFGVSTDGVRAKLGVEEKDLPDSDISLAKAFLSFQATTPTVDQVFTPSQVAAIGDAIEALAGLILIPTMAVRVATKESSGTNQYQRQAIDWADVALSLQGIINAGYLAANPVYDETSDYGSLLIVVTPATDAITGA